MTTATKVRRDTYRTVKADDADERDTHGRRVHVRRPEPRRTGTRAAIIARAIREA